MTRSPLGQLTNLLACINNELTHKTTKKGKQRTDWQKCDRNKNKKSIDLCQLVQEEEDGGGSVGGTPAYLSAIWLPCFMDSHRVCCPFAHRHTLTWASGFDKSMQFINSSLKICRMFSGHPTLLSQHKQSAHTSRHHPEAHANLICPPRGLSAAPNKYS